jgi:hypothetical protein
MAYEIYVLKVQVQNSTTLPFIAGEHRGGKSCKYQRLRMVSTVSVWLSRLPSNETEVRFDYFLCSASLGVLATRESENASNRETEGLCIKVTTSFRTLPISWSVRTASE